MALPKILFALLIFLASVPALGGIDQYSWGIPRVREDRGVFRLLNEPQGALLNASTNSLGQRFLPATLQSALRGTGKVEIAVGVTSWLTLFAQGRFVLQSVNSLASYGFGDQTLGAHWTFFESESKQTQIGVQSQVDLPAFYSHSTGVLTTTPDLGDGSIDASAHLFWRQDWIQWAGWGSDGGHFLTNVGLGGQYRSLSFAASLPWSLSLEIAPEKSGLLLSASTHGNISLGTDPYSYGSTQRPTSGSGGTQWTYASNPSWISAGAQLGYQVNRLLSFAVSVQQGLWGLNAPILTSAALSLRLRLGSSDENARPQGSNRGFAQYDLTAILLRVQDAEHQVTINRGQNDGVAIGQVFDIFKEQGEKLNQPALARGRVISVLQREAVIEVEEYFQETLLNPRSVARRLLQQSH